MTTKKLILFLPIIAMGLLTSCSTESVRTDDPGTSRNIGVDTLNSSQLRKDEATPAPATATADSAKTAKPDSAAAPKADKKTKKSK